MTGPEHYHKAEQLLVSAVYWRDVSDSTDLPQHLTAQAQVHATLAQAAAAALPLQDHAKWCQVVGVGAEQ